MPTTQPAWAALGILHTPASATDVLSQAMTFAHKTSHHSVFWRGIDSDEFRQCPSLARALGVAPQQRMAALAEWTKRLLEEASAASYHWTSGHEFRHYEVVEQLALLQHSEVDTPLLDVTHSSFVACWFASQNNSAQDGLLLGFSVPSSHIARDPKEYSKKQSLQWPDKPRFVIPPFIDSRVRAQQAAFLLSPLLQKESMASPVSQIMLPGVGSCNGETIAIRIKKGLKNELRHILQRTYGISAESLFPDLPGFRKIRHS